MSFNYSGLNSTALRLIESFGRAFTLVKATSGTYDTATSATPVATASYAFRGVFPAQGHSRRGASDVDSDVRSLMVAAKGLAVVPAISDKISDTLQVVAVEAIKPGDTVLAYKLGVRK
jgi:hypothetical protein